MGEIVVSSEGMMDLEVREAEPPQTAEDSGPAAVVRWEKFLPRMALRVLLVEADDSTRQIIAALLRKCSYKGLYLLVLLSVLMNCLTGLLVLEEYNFSFL